MLVASNNLRHYLDLPTDCVIRINLAWYADLKTIAKQIEECERPVMLDVPSGRKKPPTNTYTVNEIYSLSTYDNLKYIAVSNVESRMDLEPYLAFIPKTNLVPKIETLKGIENIDLVLDCLSKPKTIMLDHEDLYNDLLRNGLPPCDLYNVYVKMLKDHCSSQEAIVLATAGIVFWGDQK